MYTAVTILNPLFLRVKTGQVSEDFGRQPSVEAPPAGATTDKSGAGYRPSAARLHYLAAPNSTRPGDESLGFSAEHLHKTKAKSRNPPV